VDERNNCYVCSPLTNAPLPAWLRGIERWGQDALVRAAVAAAREAWPELHRACQGCGTAWRPFANRPWRCDCGKAWAAIEAAEACLACRCEAHRRQAIQSARRVVVTAPWAAAAGRALVDQRGEWVEDVSCAARVLGDEARVRAAICRALIPVALGVR